jgi:hypothetical protein
MIVTTRRADIEGNITEITTDTPSSVEVTRSAKGTYQFSVKIYCGTEPRDIAFAANEAHRITTMLEMLYEGRLSS